MKLAITLAALAGVLWISIWWLLILQSARRFSKWRERDIALTQAFHDYLGRGDIEEARECRQAALRNFNEQFKP